MCSFQKKKTFFLCLYEDMCSHFKLQMETFSYFVMVLHPNINFLINKQTKQDTKNWSKNVEAIGWHYYS